MDAEKRSPTLIRDTSTTRRRRCRVPADHERRPREFRHDHAVGDERLVVAALQRQRWPRQRSGSRTGGGMSASLSAERGRRIVCVLLLQRMARVSLIRRARNAARQVAARPPAAQRKRIRPMLF